MSRFLVICDKRTPVRTVYNVARWTRFVLRRKLIVVATWLVLFVLGGWGASQLSALLTNRFTLPGTDTARAEKILHDHFHQRSTGTFLFVAKTRGDAQSVVPALERAARRAAAKLPTGRFAGARAVGNNSPIGNAWRPRVDCLVRNVDVARIACT